MNTIGIAYTSPVINILTEYGADLDVNGCVLCFTSNVKFNPKSSGDISTDEILIGQVRYLDHLI